MIECYLGVGLVGGVVEGGGFGVEGIGDDGLCEFFFEEDGEDFCGLTLTDAAAIGLVVVEDQELARANDEGAAVDGLFFFAGGEGLEG